MTPKSNPEIFRIDPGKKEFFLKQVLRNDLLALLPFFLILVLFSIAAYFTASSEKGTITGISIFFIIFFTGLAVFGSIKRREIILNILESEFHLTQDHLAVINQKYGTKNFKFKYIRLVKKRRSATFVFNGKISFYDLYLSKGGTAFKLQDKRNIYIPNITENYLELIEKITQRKAG